MTGRQTLMGRDRTRRLLGAAVVSGAMVLGTAGAAFGATEGGAGNGGGAAPAGTGTRCALAPKALARLERIDTRITTGLPKLQSAEQRAASAGRSKVASRIGKRITRVEHLQQKVDARIARIEQRCPGVTPTAAPQAGGTTGA